MINLLNIEKPISIGDTFEMKEFMEMMNQNMHLDGLPDEWGPERIIEHLHKGKISMMDQDDDNSWSLKIKPTDDFKIQVIGIEQGRSFSDFLKEKDEFEEGIKDLFKSIFPNGKVISTVDELDQLLSELDEETEE